MPTSLLHRNISLYKWHLSILGGSSTAGASRGGRVEKYMEKWHPKNMNGNIWDNIFPYIFHYFSIWSFHMGWIEYMEWPWMTYGMTHPSGLAMSSGVASAGHDLRLWGSKGFHLPHVFSPGTCWHDFHWFSLIFIDFHSWSHNVQIQDDHVFSLDLKKVTHNIT